MIQRKAWYSKETQDKLIEVFTEVIFKPIFDVLAKFDQIDLLNQKTSALKSALNTGRIQYKNGEFTGVLSAAISKELRGIGANFNKLTKSFKINPLQVPNNLLGTITTANMKAQQMFKEVDGALNTIKPPEQSIDFSGQMLKATLDMEKDFLKMKNIVSIGSKLTPQMADNLLETYTDSVNLQIKNWTVDATKKLRKEVEKATLKGYRFDYMRDAIMKEMKITKNKADFLARQESSLYASGYRRERYLAADVTRYKWKTAGDVRVRDDHKVLNGKIFSFGQPPITDRSTGAKNEPGEDFRCRCIANPIVE